jgi:hypothetical protein
VSLRRFLGWEPVETHVTEHPDGTVTTTTVTREPEWDESTRQAAYALYEDKAERCPDCGRLRSECSDPETLYYPQLTRCWATAAREVATRKWRAKNEHAKPDSAGYKPDDGTSVWVSEFDLTPDDDFI